jgi:opacity protein-like surface antigen
MKKVMIMIVSIYLLIFCSAAKAVENSYEYKLGTAYTTDPDKWGLQLNFVYYYEYDPYIVLGLEPGVYWLNWEKKVGEEQQGTGVTADVKADSNAYMFPLMANGQIRLPNLRNKLYFLPHITLGLGYSFMIYNYKQPEYIDSVSGLSIDAQNKTKLYTGLTWQILVGGTFKPGPESAFGFLLEAGYRGSKLKKGNLEVDMSSYMINIGVRYPFGGPKSGGMTI